MAAEATLEGAVVKQELHPLLLSAEIVGGSDGLSGQVAHGLFGKPLRGSTET